MDVKLWKNQWANTIFCSHGSNHSAGVLILFHKFKFVEQNHLMMGDGIFYHLNWIIQTLLSVIFVVVILDQIINPNFLK